jgi:hypothetical protein
MASQLDNLDDPMSELGILKYYGRRVGAVCPSEADADRELPGTLSHHASNDLNLGVPEALEQLGTTPPFEKFQKRQIVFWTSVARRLLALYVARPLGKRDAGDPGAQLFGGRVVDLIDQYLFVPTSVMGISVMGTVWSEQAIVNYCCLETALWARNVGGSRPL